MTVACVRAISLAARARFGAGGGGGVRGAFAVARAVPDGDGDVRREHATNAASAASSSNSARARRTGYRNWSQYTTAPLSRANTTKPRTNASTRPLELAAAGGAAGAGANGGPGCIGAPGGAILGSCHACIGACCGYAP